MTILGIETSCDETSAAVVENGTKLLSLVTATSQDMHQKYGGIIPDRAAREQLKSILPVIHEALLPITTNDARSANDAKLMTSPAIDALAVTVGPGLIGSLLIGVETAKSLALVWNIPIIPINHLIGHIYANWLTDLPQSLFPSDHSNHYEPTTNHSPVPQFPAIVLLVSGGHTELILMKDHGKFQPLGSTLDDAAGECFDKCGRLLGLPYPYGPYIEKEAEKFSLATSHQQLETRLPRPLISSRNFDFSFSGLKTAFLNQYNKLNPNHQSNHHEPITNHSFVPALAHELQEAVTDVLVAKVVKAAQKYSPKSIIICGGVAANKRLREKLLLATSRQQLATKVFIPPIRLCTDSAAYIASAAFFNNKPLPLNKIAADPCLTITS